MIEVRIKVTLGGYVIEDAELEGVKKSEEIPHNLKKEESEIPDKTNKKEWEIT